MNIYYLYVYCFLINNTNPLKMNHATSNYPNDLSLDPSFGSEIDILLALKNEELSNNNNNIDNCNPALEEDTILALNGRISFMIEDREKILSELSNQKELNYLLQDRLNLATEALSKVTIKSL